MNVIEGAVQEIVHHGYRMNVIVGVIKLGEKIQKKNSDMLDF